MGQITYGLLYGIPEPEGDTESLLDRWRNECAHDIQEMEASKTLVRSERASSRFVPEYVYTDSEPSIGFIFAAGASGRAGVPDMPECLALHAIDTTDPWRARLEVVRPRWWRFTQWAEQQGIILPAATLMLVAMEVA